MIARELNALDIKMAGLSRLFCVYCKYLEMRDVGLGNLLYIRCFVFQLLHERDEPAANRIADGDG